MFTRKYQYEYEKKKNLIQSQIGYLNKSATRNIKF